MGKAKGKTTGKEHLQGTDDGGEVDSKDTQKAKAWGATVKRPSGDPSDPDSDVEVYGGIVLYDSTFFLNFDIPLTDDDVITVAKDSTVCDKPAGGPWLTKSEECISLFPTIVDMEIVNSSSGRTVGARLRDSDRWLISAEWPGDDGSKIQPVTFSTTTEIDNTSLRLFTQKRGTWPTFESKATERSTNWHATQFGFDTREYRTLAGGVSTDGGLRVLAAGTLVRLDPNVTKTLTRPLDAWKLPVDHLKGPFSLSRATITPTRTTEVSTSAVDIAGRSLFTATAMKSIAAGTAITYTHKVYYKDNGVVSLLGYLRVEGSTNVTGMSWFVNDAVSMAGGDWALNPNREIQCSPAGPLTNITLPAGTWYWCRSTKTSL